MAVLLGSASPGMAAIPAGISGKVVLPLSLSFVSIPATTFTGGFSSLTCTLTLSSDDVLTKEDSIAMPAVVSGKTASCSLSLSYLWHVQNAKSHMTVGYSISANGVNPATGTQTAARIASGTVDIITLPASGTTTTYKTVALTL
jgi:hypothetical protein